MSLLLTASQTIGPYLHIGTTWLDTPDLVRPGVTGQRITVQGRMLDGDGKPVGDGLVEIWQANAHGKLAHPEDRRELPQEAGFRGWGRVPTDKEGRFRFSTIRPGRVPGPGGSLQAPHIAVTVFGRGLTKQLLSRIYFPDGEGHEDDFVLKQVPQERRATLIARPVAGHEQAYEWDIVLQAGPQRQAETVFFDL
jgi:protocatechuate 3,4-dioxygenase, alpha subunit